MLRALGLSLLLGGTLWADVAVLKGGTRVAGKIVEKTDHYEVTTEGVLRTFLKDEVERIVSSPKEFLGDADKLIDEARADYQKALGLSAPAEQNAVLKGAIAKVAQAREAYSTALDLFPDDGTLGKQIMIVIQLMRLLRERVHLDETRLPGSGPSISRPTSAPIIAQDDGLTTLVDPAKRNDPARRAAALASFKGQTSEFAAAAIQFLSQTEPVGPAAKATQDYFDKPWLRNPSSLTPATHLEAAKFIGTLGVARDVLQPFAIVHLIGAGQDPEVEKTAKSLNLLVQNGIIGTVEGHAVRDLDTWIAQGDFDLAVLAFVNDYRQVDTPSVRFVWSYALLRLVQARKHGFERPVSAYETVKISLPGGADHLAALEKSIKAVAICNVCAGQGRYRCTNCHGKKETKYYCQRCKGTGSLTSSLGAKLVCPPCRGTGIDRIVKCEKCKDGYVDCKQCDHKPHPAPSMDDIVSVTPCAVCDGRGMAFRSAAVPCRACLGLGAKLVPKSDPSKVLP
ncbi:MAG TPA: hypothetical protein VMU54_01355 [Planctomycetota bacterium]|nr:hypothetical protein [Planctomycetota bacterium]